MLDRPRNAHSDVEIGRNHFAGLPDLPIVGDPALIDNSPACANRCLKLIGEGFDERKVLQGP